MKLEDEDEYEHGADVPFISRAQHALLFFRPPDELQTGAITFDLGYTIKIDRECSGQRPLITLPDSTRHTIYPLDPGGKHVDSLAEHIFNLYDARILRYLQRIVTLHIKFPKRHRKVCERQNFIFLVSIASTKRPPCCLSHKPNSFLPRSETKNPPPTLTPSSHEEQRKGHTRSKPGTWRHVEQHA